MRRFLAAALALSLLACSGAPSYPPRSTPVPPAQVTATPTPRPVAFPRDDAPHDALTEWWYYTGHLQTQAGGRYGFELVFFQSVRGTGPVGYAAHYAITDVPRGRFAFDQRTSLGSQIGSTDGFDLRVAEWTMRGSNGHDAVAASMNGYAIDLKLDSEKPPALHDRIGLISFGLAGDSYYYSRTRLDASGTLTVDGKAIPVTGIAWFDHQWGNFFSAGGGWDWFAVQMDDRTELTGSVVRDDGGKPVLVYGTYVDASGRTTHLGPEEFAEEPLGSWTSPHTGATYPSGWRLRVPAPELDLELRPVLSDQELDTRPTTGVAYWEGAVDVVGTARGRPLHGQGYVELTGYAAGAR